MIRITQRGPHVTEPQRSRVRQFPAMRRVQAFLLLLAISASTASALAQAMHYPVPMCCADGMCPAHRSQNSHSTSQGKAVCGGALASMACCSMSCSGSNESEKVNLPLVSEAVLQPAQELPAPRDVRGAAIPVVAIGSSGFVSSPEQPPRR